MEKRILTDEERKKLAGYMPFNCKNTINFTPSLLENIDENLRPVFKLRSLSNEEHNQLKIYSSKYFKDIEGKNPEEQLEILKVLTKNTEEIIRRCVLGFSNFFDVGSGEEIIMETEYNQNYISKEHYSLIPEWVRVEITNYVRKISNLVDPEKLSLK